MDQFLVTFLGVRAIKRISFIAAAFALILNGNLASADWVGTQGLADIGGPTLSPGNDILTATTFTVGNMVSTGSNTGIFNGLSNQFLGSIAINTANPSVSFGNSTLGYFTSTNMVEETKAPGNGGLATTVNFLFDGTYTGGSYTGPGTSPASFQLTFNQQGPGSAISDSGTLVVPTAVSNVPEPTSLALFAVGAPFLMLARRLRRKPVIG